MASIEGLRSDPSSARCMILSSMVLSSATGIGVNLVLCSPLDVLHLRLGTGLISGEDKGLIARWISGSTPGARRVLRSCSGSKVPPDVRLSSCSGLDVSPGLFEDWLCRSSPTGDPFIAIEQCRRNETSSCCCCLANNQRYFVSPIIHPLIARSLKMKSMTSPS